MASCSDRDRIKKTSFDNLSVTQLVNSTNLNENEKLINLKMPKKTNCLETKQNNTQNLEALSDDEFQSLLEEATTYNIPINQASALLQKLHKECLDTVNKHTLEAGMHRNKKNKSSKSKTRVNNDSLFVDGCPAGVHEPSRSSRNEHSINKRIELAKDEASLNYNPNWTQHSLKKHDPHSHSLQDLAWEHSSEGRPKNSRKHSSVQRASSFSSCSETSRRLDCLTLNKGANKSTLNTDATKDVSNSALHSDVISSPVLKPCDTPLLDSNPPIDLRNSQDIEMEELDVENRRPASNNVWSKQPFDLRNRRKSDGDKGKAFISEVDDRVGFPLKKMDSPDLSNRPLHKSTGDFVQSHYSDILGNLSNNPEANGIALKPFKQTSVVPMFDYSNASNEISKSESHRKSKKKPNVENQNVILSQDIEGHRANQSVDELVKFINSSDKKTNKPGKNSYAQGNRDSDRRRSAPNNNNNNKTSKNNKNLINGSKKRSTNLKEEKLPYEQSNNNNDSDNASGEEDEPSYQQQGDRSNTNSEIHELSNATNNNLPESSLTTSLEENISGFAADFYAFSPEGSSQNYDEEFHVVMPKKQRKRRQMKSDSYRRHNASNIASNGSILRDFKQDSGRRKSASSMPPSENSSVDNSDLDSVHSLPVNGSVPPPAIRPHTSPSSMSSTPQASYADIARMSMSASSKSQPSSNSSTSHNKLSQTNSASADVISSSHSNNTGPKAGGNKTDNTKTTKNVPNSAAAISKTTKESVTQTDPIAAENPPGLLPAVTVPPLIETKLAPPPTNPPPPVDCVIEKQTVIKLNCNKTETTKPVNKKQIESETVTNLDLYPLKEDFETLDEITAISNCSISFGFELEELIKIKLIGTNGASELNFPLLPKRPASKEKDKKTIDLNEARTVSLSSSSPANTSSGHINVSNTIDASSNYNYVQIVNFFKTEWSTLQNGTNKTIFEKAMRYHE